MSERGQPNYGAQGPRERDMRWTEGVASLIGDDNAYLEQAPATKSPSAASGSTSARTELAPILPGRSATYNSEGL
jgi:hypothetical protein